MKGGDVYREMKLIPSLMVLSALEQRFLEVSPTEIKTAFYKEAVN